MKTREEIEPWFNANTDDLKPLFLQKGIYIHDVKLFFKNELTVLKTAKETNRQYVNAIDRLNEYINWHERLKKYGNDNNRLQSATKT